MAPRSNKPSATASSAKSGGSPPAKGTQHAKFTSPRGRKSKKDCKQNKNKPGWYLRYLKFDGGVGGVFLTLSDFVNDAFNKPILDSIANEEDETLPLYSAATLRKSLTNGEALTNAKDTYRRRVFLQVWDEGDETDEACLATLKTIKAFMELKENNRYGTPVYIQETGWKMNNSDEDLPKLDKCIIHDDIVRFIKDCFEGTDAPGWAQDNMDVAMCFFTEGHIPSVAVDQLGFEASACLGPLGF